MYHQKIKKSEEESNINFIDEKVQVDIFLSSLKYIVHRKLY